MANLTPTAVSKSSNFVTGPSGDKTNDVLSDLLANRTETYANMTSIADEFYGATPPANPNVGRKWRCSTTAGLYVANTTYRWNGSAWAIDIAETVSVPQRNCVLEGPVNSAGATILFSVGTGLTVDLKATVRLSFANGFTDDGGASDYFESITSDDAAFWSSLPINSMVQLYFDRESNGTVRGGYSTFAPVYQSYAPTHSAGLNWFDTNTQKMFVSNGSAWTQVWRVFVGTATTNGTQTTAVTINVNNSSDIVKANDIITKGPWVDVRAFGAKGDGVTDDTAAIKASIAYALANNIKMVVLFGTHLMTPTSNYEGLITMHDGLSVVFLPGASIKLGDSNITAYGVIFAFYVDNWEVVNLTVVGDRALKEARSFVDGETAAAQGHGVWIRGCKNWRFDGDVNVSEMWGDGVLIDWDPTYNIENYNGHIDRVIGHRCSRNTVTIASGVNVSITEIVSSNCDRTNPKCALDIEPGTGGALDNINIKTIKSFDDPNGVAIRFFSWSLPSSPKIASINIGDILISGTNSTTSGWFFASYPATENPVGSVRINSITMPHAKQSAMSFNNFIQDGIDIYINKIDINIEDGGATNPCFAFYFTTGTRTTSPHGKVIMDNIKLTGDHTYIASIATGTVDYAKNSGIRFQKFLNKQTKGYFTNLHGKITDYQDDNIVMNCATIPASSWATQLGYVYENSGATSSKYLTAKNLFNTVFTLDVRTAQFFGVSATGATILPASLAYTNGFKSSEVGAKITYIQKENGSFEILSKIGNWVSYT